MYVQADGSKDRDAVWHFKFSSVCTAHNPRMGDGPMIDDAPTHQKNGTKDEIFAGLKLTKDSLSELLERFTAHMQYCRQTTRRVLKKAEDFGEKLMFGDAGQGATRTARKEIDRLAAVYKVKIMCQLGGTAPGWVQDLKDKRSKVKRAKATARAKASAKVKEEKITSKSLVRKRKREDEPSTAAGTPAGLPKSFDSMALARLLKKKIIEEAAKEGAVYDPSKVGRLLFSTIMGMGNGDTLLSWTEQEDVEEPVTKPLAIVDLIVDKIKNIAGAKEDLVAKLNHHIGEVN